MEINFSGRHVETTDSLRDVTNKKFERLNRHFDQILSIDVTFDVEHLTKIVKATIRIPGNTVHATSENEDMYAALDKLVLKLEHQLDKYKGKTGNH